MPAAFADGDLRGKLVFTYYNREFTDGVGAQLQRIYGIYAMARLLGASYLHTPLRQIDYQGFSALQMNVLDPNYHQRFNDVFRIPSDVAPTDDFFKVNLRDVYPEYVEQFVGVYDSGQTEGKPILLRVLLPYGITDRHPDCYEACKDVSPFASPPRQGRKLRVVVHVRRGDLWAVASDRMLPNAYYVNVALGVARVLDACGIDHQVEVWTEVPDGAVAIQPDQKGLLGTIDEPVIVTPEMCGLQDFDVLPNVVYHINDSALDCFGSFATADVFVMSRSSFSYLGGILNRHGVVIYYPFWHGVPSSWIDTDPDGHFDPARLMVAVTALPPA